MEKIKLQKGLKYGSDFNNEERIAIIEDYLIRGASKREIWKKYTGQDQEHGQILNWMRQFGYETPKKGLNCEFNHP